MPYSKYELHDGYDENFPLKFHLDKIRDLKPHWHEHIELLYIKSGSFNITGGDVTHILSKGDVIVFTPDCVHGLQAVGNGCEYYCITIDRRFCASFGIPASHGQFSWVSTGGDINSCYSKIIRLMKTQPLYYREEVKALILRILAIVYRSYNLSSEMCGKVNNKMISQAIEYLNTHFSEPVTVEELSEYVGFSKYYFCRTFKQVTGKTVVDYINHLRCLNAKRLILSGQYNVSESARLSGFNNLSYFSRTYIKHMGVSPSNEKQS